MTDDIVHRLRNPNHWLFQIIGPKSGATVQGESDAPREAANEIERLRAELAASTHKIISQRSSTGSERPTSNREVEGSTPSVEAALRADLAAETEQVMRLTAELTGVKACLKSLEKHFARAKGNTQSMKLSRNAARAERDELRELLAEAVQWLCVSDLPCAMTIHRINAALKEPQP